MERNFYYGISVITNERKFYVNKSHHNLSFNYIKLEHQILLCFALSSALI